MRKFWLRFYAKCDVSGEHPSSRYVNGFHCILWTGTKTKDGYGQFRRNGKRVYAHRVILEEVIGRELRKGEQANHICDVPACVAPEHLFLGNPKANMADKVAKGRQSHVSVHGEQHGRAKLTESDIRRIFEMRAAGCLQREIAEALGVAQRTISHILRGECWKHVGPTPTA